MTLVLNEIHMLDGFKRTALVAAADRRITDLTGSKVQNQRKLFRISYLNGAVAYFGLATFRNSAGRLVNLWDVLPSFIRSHSSVPDLETFAHELRDELHRIVPKSVLGAGPSGFQICGYNAALIPEYWILWNIREMRDHLPIRIKSSYKKQAPVFLGDHAKRLGWDGQDLGSCANGIQIYRNGDFRGHAAAWDLLDDIFKQLWLFSDFRRPRTIAEYRDYVRFKFEFIARIQDKWSISRIIGKPIDVLVWFADATLRQLTVV